FRSSRGAARAGRHRVRGGCGVPRDLRAQAAAAYAARAGGRTGCGARRSGLERAFTNGCGRGPPARAFCDGAAMRLTTFTDYSLRVLMFVAAHPEERATIAEIAQAFDISE